MKWLLLTLWCMGTALAVEDPQASPEEGMQSKQPTEDLPIDQIDHQESRKARLTRRYSTGIQWGDFVGSITGVGAEASFFRNSQTHLGVSYMTGTEDLRDNLKSSLDSDGLSLERVEVGGQALMFHARRFIGNSFNVKYALGQRLLNADVKVSDSTGSSIEVETVSRSYSVELTLSNRWYWFNGFYLGCDWFGIMYPLTSSYESKVTTTGPVTDQFDRVQEDAVDLAQTLGKSMSYSSLVLQLGYIF